MPTPVSKGGGTLGTFGVRCIVVYGIIWWKMYNYLWNKLPDILWLRVLIVAIIAVALFFLLMDVVYPFIDHVVKGDTATMS